MFSAPIQHQVVDHSTATLELYESASQGLNALNKSLASILESQSLQINERLFQWRNELPTFSQIIELSHLTDFDHSEVPQLILSQHESFLCIPLDKKIELVVSDESLSLEKLIHSENLKSLLHHICQALILSHRICRQKQELHSSSKVLDHYPIPLLAVDNHLNTIFSNKMARQQFSNTINEKTDNLLSSLRVQAREHVDILSLCDKQSQRLEIRNSLLNCIQPFEADRVLSKITLEGRSYPIVISSSDSVPNIFQHFSRSAVAWVYILVDSYSHVLEKSTSFQNLDLSKSEKKLCAQLFDGKTLSDIAKHRRVSEQTVRKQLQSTLRKTHLDSQEALIIYLFENCIETGLVK